MTDEQLLSRFFAEARTPLPDNGFTDRVMAALPPRQATNPSWQSPCAQRITVGLPLHQSRSAQQVTAGSPSPLPSIRRYHIALNLFALAASLAILISVSPFSQIHDWMQTTLLRLFAEVLAIDADSLLVNLMLAIHRLPTLIQSLLPTPLQLTAVFALLTLLSYQAIETLARRKPGF